MQLSKVILKSFVIWQMSIWLTSMAMNTFIHWEEIAWARDHILSRDIYLLIAIFALHNKTRNWFTSIYDSLIIGMCVIPIKSPLHPSLPTRLTYTSISDKIDSDRWDLCPLWCDITTSFDIDWINLWVPVRVQVQVSFPVPVTIDRLVTIVYLWR